MRRLVTAVAMAVALVLMTQPAWGQTAPPPGGGKPLPGGQPAGPPPKQVPGQPGTGRLPNPPNRPDRGLVYDGLERATEGRCRGQFRIVGTDLCTHGPDAAPPGVDVTTKSAPVSPEAGPTPAAQCDGDGTSGKRTQVIYARASDVADRYSSHLASFRQWANGADDIYAASAAETGGVRRIRFVHDASCVITVANAVMPATGDDNFTNTMDALQALGFNRTDRKYMVFVDSNVYCGIGNIIGDDQPGAANANNGGPSYGRTDVGCWGAHTAAHEHMHNLGGVQLSAPHTSGGWHCVDEYDVMCYSDEPNYPTMQILCSNTALENRFDCNDDDYYNTNPPAGSYLATKWNAANSQYLLTTGGPGNDPFSGALPLVGSNGTAAGSNIGFTKESGEPNHAGFTGGTSAWYQWTAPASGSVSIDTFGSNFDTLLAVYTGTAVNALTPVASNDDHSGGNQSKVTFSATKNAVYRIAVDGYNAASGTIALNWVQAPPNDHFTAATILSGSNGAVPGTNVAANKQTGEPAHAGNAGGKSVWYRWTAPSSGPVTINTFGSSFDTLLGVYTGTAVDALTGVAASDDSAGGLQSQVTFTATSGVIYRIAVDGYNGASGNIALNWVQAPPNDNFTAAKVVSGSNGSVTGTSVAATKEAGEPNHGGNAGGKSVWYQWTAPATGPVTINTFGSSYDTLLGVYTGTAVNALSVVAGNDDSGTGLQSQVTFSGTQGTVYRIAVDGYNGAAGNIRLYWEQPPRNDTFSLATNVSTTPGSTNGTNVAATKQAGEPNHAGNAGGKSVWYRWTAPSTGQFTIDTFGSGFDTLLAVYTGTAVNALTPVVSNDDAGGGLQSRVTINATSGVTYRIAVDGYNGASGALKINRAAGAAPPSPPSDPGLKG